MKKLLPFIFGFIFLLGFFLFVKPQVHAQTSVTAPAFAVPLATPAPTGSATEGQWVQDAETTFVGKSAARAGLFLDWSIANYNWYSTPMNWPKSDPNSDVYQTQDQLKTTNPIENFWATIRNLVYLLLIIVVLITAFILMVTRGKSLTIRKFIPRFLAVVLLITFSFALISNLYNIVDAVQGWFLRSHPPTPCTPLSGCISQADLLYVGFKYNEFIGYRLAGIANDESAFISLLLVKLTAITYYVMVGILLIRKVILWFFIIISPIFPLLLLYAPIRNTGKIWIGEFFRWLLYAPIFAIFLSGLVAMWREFIPLAFNFSPINTGDTAVATVTYPYVTSISILLGGPGQHVGLGNSINTTNTFALYVICLIMLWVVIILPWLLLQIFLDYWHSFSFSESPTLKQLVTAGTSFVNRGPVSPNGQPPYAPAGAGMAKILPFGNKMAIPQMAEKAAQIPMTARNINAADSEILHLANLSIPTMRDIAKFETASLSTTAAGRVQAQQMSSSLQKLANPAKSSNPVERRQFSAAQSKLAQEAQKGNPLASSILSASKTVSAPNLQSMLGNLSHPTSPQMQQVHDQVMTAAASGDPLAKSLASSMSGGPADPELQDKLKEAKEKGSQLASVVLQAANVTVIQQPAQLPSTNRVQSVSLDDYEAVKSMWKENYQKLEPPKTAEGLSTSRKTWVKKEIDKMTQTINLLLSSDPKNVAKGMEAVNNILPFLLIGGFSQSEVVSYLKAKLEAAKTVAADLAQKEDEEETLLERKEKKEEGQQTMTAQEEILPDEKDKEHMPKSPDENVRT